MTTKTCTKCGMSGDHACPVTITPRRKPELPREEIVRSSAGFGDIDAEVLAKRFHETYERLAPSYGYETRKDSAVPWEKVPEKNKALMRAVCSELLSPNADISDGRERKGES